MTRKTSSVAVETAGSLVLMPRSSGISLSWIVYLSSSGESECVPLGLQRTLKASSVRILMPNEEVLVKTFVTMGKRSFLRVGKSSFGRIMGRERSARSCKACVGDSRAAWWRGRMSSLNSRAVVFSFMMGRLVRRTVRPPSRPVSRSRSAILAAAVLGSEGAAVEELGGMKTSFSRVKTFSENSLGVPCSAMANILGSTKASIEPSRSSSTSPGRIFFSSTLRGNWGRTFRRPRMKADFSAGVFAGRESRKRSVETRILSKYGLCWNSLAVTRPEGRRVRSRGRRVSINGRGRGREER